MTVHPERFAEPGAGRVGVLDDLTRIIERALSDAGSPDATDQSTGSLPGSLPGQTSATSARLALRLHRRHGSPGWTFPVSPHDTALALADRLRDSVHVSQVWLREGAAGKTEEFLTVAATQSFLVRVLDDPIPRFEGGLAAWDSPRGYPPGEGPDYARQRLTAELTLAATELPSDLLADRAALNTPADTWLLALLIETPEVYAGVARRGAAPRDTKRLHHHLEELADATLDWLTRTPPRPVTWHTPVTPAHAARAELAARILAVLPDARASPARGPDSRTAHETTPRA